MCGRFLLSSPSDLVCRLFEVEDIDLTPRWNIAPTQRVACVRWIEGRRVMDQLRWGLVPAWARDERSGARLINARSETAHTKPSFRGPMRSHRCLIPADGFYEWTGERGAKRPWCIRRVDGQPMAFAGLWDRWTRGSEPLETCTILTTTPNAVTAPIHDRMPVILDPANWTDWLTASTAEQTAPLLKPIGDEVLRAYRVDPRVNRPACDVPSCADPV